MSRRRKNIHRVLLYGFIALGCSAAAAWGVGWRLCAPARARVTAPANTELESVSFQGRSGTIRGWLLIPEKPRAAIVLMHGVRGTRAMMLSRAQFLAKAGYAALLFDFQAHGESEGEQISFGYLERQDAAAAVAFVRERFASKPVAVIGVSMGGAAALLAEPALPVNALVLESVYPTIEEAVQDRIEMVTGRYTRWLWPVLTCQLKPRIGCRACDLRPIERAAELRLPKLFIAGDRDRHTKIGEAREMFRRAAEPKEFWEVPGAAHQDMHAFCGANYEQRVLGFLETHLK